MRRTYVLVILSGFVASAFGQWRDLGIEFFDCSITKPTLVRFMARTGTDSAVTGYAFADTSFQCRSTYFGGADRGDGQNNKCQGADTTVPHSYIGLRHGKLRSIVYSVYIPQNYASLGQKYPLVVQLHGAGGRGVLHDNLGTSDYRYLASDSIQARYPSFVYFPECPASPMAWVTPNTSGGSEDWHKYRYASTNSPTTAWQDAMYGIDTLCKKYPIDTNRIYIGGGSMGGYGTWYSLMKYPKKFAAAVPVAGGGDTTMAAPFAQVPVWAFHESSDGLVDVAGSQSMIRAMQRAGGKPRLTLPANVTFPSSDEMGGHMFAMPFMPYDSLAIWLFKQNKSTTSLSYPMSGATLTAGRRALSGLVIAPGAFSRVRVRVRGENRVSEFDIRGQAIRSRGDR